MKTSKVIKGQFHSLWEEGEVVTSATLNLKTGEVTTEAVAGNGFNHLMEESFEDEEGNDYDVCSVCHTHIMRTAIVDGVGKTLMEVQECSNPDCESHES